ncbi:hypothetical protein [Phytoactinopolyspora limicola]|uniref:hypothetical protein n=1 Tax=Phytoactinopolyspora limicola TaxID=2715536 RepID=UPI001A9CA0C0|nr:hypothetical protein [Phytoactinopolyspora limicola]
MGTAALTSLVSSAVARPAENDCEVFSSAFWGQPANSVTSLAFVVAGVVIAVATRGPAQPRRLMYAFLVAATGIGSFVFHGPAPSWSPIVHDAPLVALLAFVAADAVSDLLGRRLSDVWWVAPAAVLIIVAGAVGSASTAVQGLAGVGAVSATVIRAYARPSARRTILTAGVVVGAGALIGTLSRSGGPLCQPDSLLQGHAIWHVLAAVALVLLTPVIGRVTAGRSAGLR